MGEKDGRRREVRKRNKGRIGKRMAKRNGVRMVGCREWG